MKSYPADQTTRARPRNTRDPRDGIDRDDEWRPRPRRLLIGGSLVLIAIVWSILNSTIWAGKGTQPPPAPVALRPGIQTLDGVRVLPILPATDPYASSITLRLAFQNGSGVARSVGPRDVRLLLGQRSTAGAGSGALPLRPALLEPGQQISGDLGFAQSPAAGLTLVFAPRWSSGAVLRWVLWKRATGG